MLWSVFGPLGRGDIVPVFYQSLDTYGSWTYTSERDTLYKFRSVTCRVRNKPQFLQNHTEWEEMAQTVSAALNQLYNITMFFLISPNIFVF